MQPTIVTWILVLFGVITLGTLSYIYLIFLRNPHSTKSKDLMIGKGKDWRDKTHFRLNLGFAWADFLFIIPLFLSGCVGMLLGQSWGYVLFGVAGGCTLYINIILWFTEKEYVYPALGPLKYYTYYWGFFVYWGTLAMVYSVMRITGIEF